VNGFGPHPEGLYPMPARARVDRALSIVRGLPARELLAAIWPAGLSVLVAAALYFMERVEGVRSLRPLFAVLFVGAFIARCVLLSRWSGRRVEALLSAQGVSAHHAQASSIARAALWVGAELWLWLWLVVLMLRLQPWLVALVLPTFCLRAALAPSLLASADGSTQITGFRVLRGAIHEGDGHRLAGVLCELLLLCGALGLAFNLGAVIVAIVGLGQDVLGLDLSFVHAFVSPSNHFAMLWVAGLALVAMEPLRGTLSALMFVDTRLTRDGLALRSLVARCVSEGQSGRLAAVALAAFLCATSQARAQDASVPDAGSAHEPSVPICDSSCERARASDEVVERRVEHILEGKVFAEFPDPSWDAGKSGMSSLFEELFRWLAGLSRDEQLKSDPLSSFELPGVAFFLILAAVLAVGALLVARKKQPAEATAAESSIEDPFSRSAEDYLSQARDQRGRDLTLALRSLYLATLVGLARQGRLTLSPERTNGQYLNELGGGPERPLFAAMTRTFDLVKYGQRAPSQDDFDRCVSLAEQLLQIGARP